MNVIFLLRPPPHPPAASAGGGHLLIVAVAAVVAVVVIGVLVKALSKGRPNAGAQPAGSPAAGSPAAGAQAPPAAVPADLVMDPKQYFFADDPVRARVARECAQALLPVLGGAMKEDGKDLEVTGQYRGRPTRFQISVTFGTAILEMRAPRQFFDTPQLTLEYDKEGKPAGEPQARDEWDKRDRKEAKLFLSPHIRLEGEPKELDERKGLLARLPPGLESAIVGALEQQGDGARLMFLIDSVKWWVPASLLLSRQAPARFAERLEMMGAFLSAVDQAWPDRAQLAASWPSTTGRLLAVQPTGTLINMNPQVQAVLEVSGPQGPYQTQTLAVVPQMSIPMFQPGATIQLRVNPANAADVAIVF